MITTVNTTGALVAALRSAHAGDTILLASGTYNGVALSNLNFSGDVTIQSADASHQAVINNLLVSGSSGLLFKQLTFSTLSDSAATVASSHNITFSGDTFLGQVAGSGNAMLIRNSDGVTVTGSDISKFWSGINEVNASNLTVTNNIFHGLTAQGIRGTGVTYETISGNTFADAKASVANHSDAIYLWQDNAANHVTVGANIYGASSTGSSTTGSSTTGSTTTAPATGVGGSHTVTVSSAADLMNAVQHAHAGDTILVAAGTYNGVSLSNLNFSSGVTIQSADASHQAVINNLSVSNSSGLVFNQLHLGTTSDTAVSVSSSSHDIIFSNDSVQGVATGSGTAMMIRDSANITVTGSDISKFWSGINELNSNNLTVTNNTFHDLSAQGVRGTGVTNETISGNTFADAKASVADHSDAVYLWQDNTANHVTLGANIYGTGGVATTPPTTTVSSGATGSTGSTAVTGSSTSNGSGGTTFTVGSVTELQNALKSAHGGDTILLKAGTYDGVNIYNFSYNGTVTIESADSTHQAQINNLGIGGSSGIEVKDVTVEVTGSSNYAVMVGNSSHIALDGLTIHGSTSTYDGVGVFVRSSADVSLTNSDISQLGCAVGHMEDSGLTISNNAVHNIGTDGIIGGGSSHVIISGNTFTSFNSPDGAHPDAIQFFGGATAGETGNDVLIANNVMTRGEGSSFQGIFIESTNNVTITGNALAGTMYNGIAVSATSHVLIENNFVDGYSDMGSGIITRGASSDVTVVQNTAQGVTNYAGDGANPGYVESGNTTASPTAIGDLSALKAWLAAHTGVTAALTGGAGSDIITGTTGADVMSGGLGDDVYAVNNTGDVVNEAAYAGVDTIHSSVATYTLGANVENIVLVGTTAQSGLGNGLDNVMIGNSVQSVLNGGAGDDTLVSMGGASTLTGGAGADVFTIGATPTTAVQITDFTSGQDKLDLHTLLANYHGSDPVADQWVQFQSTSSGVTVMVDVDGPSGSAGFVAVARVAGVTSLSASDWVFH